MHIWLYVCEKEGKENERKRRNLLFVFNNVVNEYCAF